LTPLRILQNELLADPKAGNVIEHSGGLRKIRFGIKGRGKRGGIRIIYFYHELKVRIYLLVSYSKNEKDDLSAKELEILRNIAKGLKWKKNYSNSFRKVLKKLSRFTKARQNLPGNSISPRLISNM
jgi:mRNA-degrading endonuclease RelE of RelBE toxin-antitoxin system